MPRRSVSQSVPGEVGDAFAAGMRGEWIVHVLITADAVGGVWTYTRELITGLLQRGIRVTLVSFGRLPSEAQTASLNELREVAYFPTAFRLEWMDEARNDLETSMCYLQAIVQQCQPDLLHLSQFCYGSLAVPQPRIVVAHSDVFSWNEAVHGSVPTGRWAEWYYGVVSAGLADASLIVAPSQWMLDAVQHHYGPVRNAQVIYNGRTPELFDCTQRKQPLAASAGRLWDEGKQSRLLTMLNNPPLPVVVAGAVTLESATPHIDAAQGSKQAHDAGVPVVRCGGELSASEMARLLASAGIYIATSRYEPFGLAPLEAAFSGCALLVNDIPSLREIWGDAAVFFRQNDAESLGEALAMLHSNHGLRERYATRAYERACRRYTATRMIDEYVRAYCALLGQNVRAA